MAVYFPLMLCLSATIPATCMAVLSAAERSAFTKNGVNISEVDGNYRFQSDGLPDHSHGPFPNSENPNTVQEQEHDFTIPRSTTEASVPGCLPMGTIGMAINGVSFFNPYTAEGYNAVEGQYKETFDDCDGHPQVHGVYHYHRIPMCLYRGTTNELLGIMFDGYLIYGPLDENGRNLTSDDLDFCNGRVYSGVYRYHMTFDFPYIIGCFHGTTLQRQMGPTGGMRPPQDGGTRPPPGDGMGPPPNGDGGPAGGAPNLGRSDWNRCYANHSQPEPAETDTSAAQHIRPRHVSMSLVCLLFAAITGGTILESRW